MNLVAPSSSQPPVPVNGEGDIISIEDNWGYTHHRTNKGVINNLYAVEIQGRIYVTKDITYRTLWNRTWTVPISIWGVEIPFPIHELIEVYGITVKALDYEVQYVN